MAVIGAGISGLGASWALSRAHRVVLYEARNRLGGHSHTVDVPTADGPVPVDTGFIVYNEVTYPHLTRLFETLDVPTSPSDMSFSVSIDGGVEYGGSARGLLAHPRNLLRRSYRDMLQDIWRFRRLGPQLLASADRSSIGDLLDAHGFSPAFVDDYLVPMMGAIWSTSGSDIRRYPAEPMLRFLTNHGLIHVTGRPRWRTVTGGSRQYVQRLSHAIDGDIRLGSPVRAIRRDHSGVEIDTSGGTEAFDQVVIAAHSDQTLRMLGDAATQQELSALSAIRYQPNVAVLHSDASLMPRSKAAWTSWNAMASAEGFDQRTSVTYWMNRLQPLTTERAMFVTLNPIVEPDPALTHGSFEYSHPQFDAAAVSAQHQLAALQGSNRTWFAGAYMGYGFHEDGLQSGLNVAAALGSPAPWHHDVVPMSSAPEPHAYQIAQR
ncbi:MAG: NAD(P)-binding protein [Acidimicrobiia bacterium]|nr:NAD(P)-binding protein [Acidimicrobiia bacterium]